MTPRGVACSGRRQPPGITAAPCPLVVATTSRFSLIVPCSLSVLYKAPTAGAWSRWWRASGWDRGEAPFDRPAANARVRRRRHRGGGGGSRPKMHARTMPLVPSRPSSRARSLAHALARALVVLIRAVVKRGGRRHRSGGKGSGRRKRRGCSAQSVVATRQPSRLPFPSSICQTPIVPKIAGTGSRNWPWTRHPSGTPRERRCARRRSKRSRRQAGARARAGCSRGPTSADYAPRAVPPPRRGRSMNSPCRRRSRGAGHCRRYRPRSHEFTPHLFSARFALLLFFLSYGAR